MAGIYIHVPFCRQACHYCNFHFSVSLRHKAAFVDCLLREIALQAGFFGPSPDGKAGKWPIDTIYLGGGTPSILSVADLVRIFEAIGKTFHVTEQAEISLEVNPDDMSREKLLAIRQTAVNRLSIGIQSFRYADLSYMNRIHSPAQALEALDNARSAGFENISADLIYGTPGMSDEHWVENLQRLFERDIPHISAYALTVEPRTALDIFIRKGRMLPVSEDQQARQFFIMLEQMEKHSYIHYEVSNFAREGYYSRHNLSYWDGSPYLGLGPSAHSYRSGQRWWNPANTSQWIQSLSRGELIQETERLSPAQQFDEYVMTSLRTRDGCDLDKLAGQWGTQRRDQLLEDALPHLKRGHLHRKGNRLLMSKSGWLFADGIAADLFWIDDHNLTG